MKRVWFISMFIMLLGGVWMNAAANGFFPYKYETYQLPNGLKAILIPMEGTELIAYYSIVRTGSRDEWEPGKSGFAHFFEHMMFRGTKRYPADVYDKMVTEMGADANAYTTDDYTCYYMVTPGEYLEKVMDLESDRFQNLFYDELAFKTEAGAVYGEYRKSRVSPWSVLYEALLNTAFDKHTYKHTTIGFEEDIKAMPEGYEYSKSFFKRYYRPENVVLLIVGNIDVAKTKALIQKYYGNWQPGYVHPKITPEPEQQGERVKEVTYHGKTLPILAVAYKGNAFDPANKMVAASYLLGNLAFGQTSDLYKQLVIREQKVQALEPDFGFNRDPKLLTIFAMVKREEDIPAVQNAIDATVEKFKTELVPAEKLEREKKHTRYAFLMNLDTPAKVAGNLARLIALTADLNAVNILYDTIAQLTPEDIRAAARHYFVQKHRTIIILKGDQ